MATGLEKPKGLGCRYGAGARNGPEGIATRYVTGVDPVGPTLKVKLKGASHKVRGGCHNGTRPLKGKPEGKGGMMPEAFPSPNCLRTCFRNPPPKSPAARPAPPRQNL